MIESLTVNERLDYIGLCLTHRCKYERDYRMNTRRKAWYTFKAVVCILLGRTGYDMDYITVASINSGQGFTGEYTEYWWENIIVGYGVFSGWWYAVDSDST